MELTIFLDPQEANHLRKVLPAKSLGSEAIAKALHTRDYWGPISRDVPIECDECQGRELLYQAQSFCPSAVEKIRRAFRLAHLWLDDAPAIRKPSDEMPLEG